MKKLIVLSGAIVAAASPLFGGSDGAVLPVPAPLAGAAFGPLGLVVAGVGYVAYRVIRARSDR